MVAVVTRAPEGESIAIHRTFLSRDGKGKAPIEPQKMMLGPCRGGAVRLAAATGRLMVGEGVETCLAAMQAAGQPTWAALSTSGLRPPVCLPRCARWSCSQTATRRARLRLGRPRYVGNDKGGASASPGRRRGLISTICFWAAHPGTRRARHDNRGREYHCGRDRKRGGDL